MRAEATFRKNKQAFCTMPCGSDFCIFFQKIQKFKKSLDE